MIQWRAIGTSGVILGLVAISCQASLVPASVEVLQGPDGWRAVAPRKEIAPQFKIEKQDSDDAVLVIAASGSKATHGWWTKDFDVTPGNWYRFKVEYQAKDVTLPRRSVLARVTRLNTGGLKIQHEEFPLTLEERTADGWNIIAGTYGLPFDGPKARVDLVLRWSSTGEVRWRHAELTKIGPPEPRKVRIAAVRYRPNKRTSGPKENLELFAAAIRKAGQQKADIICVGEAITMVNSDNKWADVAEPIPGPSTAYLGRLSKKFHCYIVAGLSEKAGEAVYNVAVLMGPDGELVGSYRKVGVWRDEIIEGVAPGNAYPVFETRFGKVGMMIGWDIAFPEVARRLAINGAEIILAPTWSVPTELIPARAIENQVYVVTSTYNPRVPTAIFDRSGKVLAETSSKQPVAIAEIDLNKVNFMSYLHNVRERIPRERPPLDKEILTAAD